MEFLDFVEKDKYNDKGSPCTATLSCTGKQNEKFYGDPEDRGQISTIF